MAINAQREHRSQSHHAAHRRHVVQVRLRVLDVAAAVTDSQRGTEWDKKQTLVITYLYLKGTICEFAGKEALVVLVVLLLAVGNAINCF